MNTIRKYEISLYEINQKDVQNQSDRKESETGRWFSDQNKNQFQSIQETQRIHLETDVLDDMGW
jgi:hypothetical protein